jgi:hypothetical protein
MSGTDVLEKSGNDRLTIHVLMEATRGFNGFRKFWNSIQKCLIIPERLAAVYAVFVGHVTGKLIMKTDAGRPSTEK